MIAAMSKLAEDKYIAFAVQEVPLSPVGQWSHDPSYKTLFCGTVAVHFDHFDPF